MRNNLKGHLVFGLCVASLFFAQVAKAENGFSVSLVKQVGGFLWEPANVNGTIYSGSYNADPSVNQKYYSASDPSSSSSWHSTEVSNTKNHESTRTYNLNGNFYVTSEGVPKDKANSSGSLILPNGSKTAAFEYQFNLLGVYYNGNYIVGWAPRDDSKKSYADGTKLYNIPPSGGKTSLKHVKELMAFNGVEYNGKLYLHGCDVNKYYKDNGSGMLVEMGNDWNYKIVTELRNKGGIGRLKVFDNKLFIATGKTVQLYSYDGSNYVKEKEFASDFEVGSMEVYNNTLFVAVAKQGQSNAEVWYRKKGSSTWNLAVSNNEFKALGTAPGGAGNLVNASGWLVADSKALYAIFVKGSSARQGVNGGENQSYIYKITSSGSNDPEPKDPSKNVPADFSGVKWLHTDVSDWEETSLLSSVKFTDSTITLNYDKAKVWPATYVSEIGDEGEDLNGNPWIFVNEGGVWYAATWEWLKYGQTSKAVSAVDGGSIKVSPLDDFKPVLGETYGFMVSGLARGTTRNVKERSNVVMVKWAEDTEYDPNEPQDEPVLAETPSNSATINIYLRDDSCSGDQGYRMLTADPLVWQTSLASCTTDGRYYCVDDNQKCSTTSGSAIATVGADKEIYAPGETITVSSSGSFVTSCSNAITSNIVAEFQGETKVISTETFESKGDFSNNNSVTYTAPTTVGSYTITVGMDYSHPPFYYTKAVALTFEVKEGGEKTACVTSADCADGGTCEEGYCTPKSSTECTTSDDCGVSASCEEGYCVVKESDEDCKVDDPTCDEHTCYDVYCFDGCDFLPGLLEDCSGKQ